MEYCDLFNVAGGRRLFGEFLRSEFSEENLLFWLACEDLREEQNSERVCEKVQQIYDDYVSILSPKEASNVSLTITNRLRSRVKPGFHYPS